MNDIRSKFEEIWPLPEGIYWDGDEYMPEDDLDIAHQKYLELAVEHDVRLDTFTRCQEMTAIYSTIVDDMIREMELINSVSNELRVIGIAREAIGRAKQKMGVMK